MDEQRPTGIPYVVKAAVLPILFVVVLFVVAIFMNLSTGSDIGIVKLSVGDARHSSVSATNPAASNLPRTFIRDGKAVYVNGGSSSCPPTIKSARYERKDNTVVLISTSYPSNRACTDNYGIFEQEIIDPSGERIPSDAQIVVRKSSYAKS